MRNTWSLALCGTLVAGFVVACSSGSNSGSGGGGNSIVANTETTEITGPSGTASIQGGAPAYTYQFSQNGCDTGVQKFSGIDEATDMPAICVGLQDDEKNKSCAPDLREAHFRKLCGGYLWKADGKKEKSESPLLPHLAEELKQINLTKFIVALDTVKGGRIRSALNNQIIHNIKISENLSDDEAALARSVLEPMRSCGFDLAGGLCNGSIIKSLSYVGSAEDVKEDKILAIQYSIQGQPHPIILAYKVSGVSIKGLMNTATVSFSRADSVKMYKVLRTFSAYDLVKDYLADRNSTIELGSAQVVSDAYAEAMNRAENGNSKNVAEFHSTMVNLFANKSITNGLIGAQTFGSILDKNKALVMGSEDSNNQYALLALLENEIGVSNFGNVKRFCESLTETKTISVKQAAAACVLERDPENKQVRPLVYQALNHERGDIRLRALKALVAASPSPAEINMILVKLNDRSKNVHNFAVRYLKETLVDRRADISPENLDTLVASLGYAMSEKNKLYVIDVIDKIKDAKASNALVDLMNSKNFEIAMAAANKLASRSVLPEETRIGLLKRINSYAPEMQGTLVNIIGKREISEAAKTDLLKNLQTYSPEIQERLVELVISFNKSIPDAVYKEILANINNYSPLAQDSIIMKFHMRDFPESTRLDMLNRLNSFDVRIQGNLADMIRKGGLPEQTKIEVLKNLNSYNEAVQKKLVSTISMAGEMPSASRIELLEKITSYAPAMQDKLFEIVLRGSNPKLTASILLDKLDHKDISVRERVYTELDKRELGRESVAVLSTALDSANKQTRINAAKLLEKANVGNSRAVNALTVRLSKEADLDVRQQLEASVRILLKKL